MLLLNAGLCLCCQLLLLPLFRYLRFHLLVGISVFFHGFLGSSSCGTQIDRLKASFALHFAAGNAISGTVPEAFNQPQCPRSTSNLSIPGTPAPQSQYATVKPRLIIPIPHLMSQSDTLQCNVPQLHDNPIKPNGNLHPHTRNFTPRGHHVHMYTTVMVTTLQFTDSFTSETSSSPPISLHLVSGKCEASDLDRALVVSL